LTALFYRIACVSKPNFVNFGPSPVSAIVTNLLYYDLSSLLFVFTRVLGLGFGLGEGGYREKNWGYISFKSMCMSGVRNQNIIDLLGNLKN
jgi:hypothetical protein